MAPFISLTPNDLDLSNEQIILKASFAGSIVFVAVNRRAWSLEREVSRI